MCHGATYPHELGFGTWFMYHIRYGTGSMCARSKPFRNKDRSTGTYLQLVKGETVAGKIR